MDSNGRVARYSWFSLNGVQNRVFPMKSVMSNGRTQSSFMGFYHALYHSINAETFRGIDVIKAYFGADADNVSADLGCGANSRIMHFPTCRRYHGMRSYKGVNGPCAEQNGLQETDTATIR